jgi:hypothetical protein
VKKLSRTQRAAQSRSLRYRYRDYPGYWFAAIGKALFFCPAIFGSFFGNLLTGTNTPLAMSYQ